jgi:hypothetical protein
VESARSLSDSRDERPWRSARSLQYLSVPGTGSLLLTATASAPPLVPLRPPASGVRSGFRVGGKPPLPAGRAGADGAGRAPPVPGDIPLRRAVAVLGTAPRRTASPGEPALPLPRWRWWASSPSPSPGRSGSSSSRGTRPASRLSPPRGGVEPTPPGRVVSPRPPRYEVLGVSLADDTALRAEPDEEQGRGLTTTESATAGALCRFYGRPSRVRRNAFALGGRSLRRLV